MPNKKTRRSCEICGIKESHLESPLFFANFPLDENRCKKWVQVTGKEDLLYLPIEKLNTIKHICGKHFKNKHMNKKGNKLKKCAVPSLNLMQSPLSDAQMLQFPLHISKNPQELPEMIQVRAKGVKRRIIENEEVLPPSIMDHDYCSLDEPSPYPNARAHPTLAELDPLPVKEEESFSPEPMACDVDDPLGSPRADSPTEFEEEGAENESVNPGPSSNAALRQTVPVNNQTIIPSQSSQQVLKPVRQVVPVSNVIKPLLNQKQVLLKPVVQQVRRVAPVSADNDMKPPQNPQPVIKPVVRQVVPVNNQMRLQTQQKSYPIVRQVSPVNNEIRLPQNQQLVSSSSVSPVNTQTGLQQNPQPITTTATKLPYKQPDKQPDWRPPMSKREKQLLTRLQAVKKELSKFRKRVKQIDTITSPVLKTIIEAAIQNHRKKAKGVRWTPLHKSVAVKLYRKSPPTYKYLQELLPMPSVRTLHMLINDSLLKPEEDPDQAGGTKPVANTSFRDIVANALDETDDAVRTISLTTPQSIEDNLDKLRKHIGHLNSVILRLQTQNKLLKERVSSFGKNSELKKVVENMTPAAKVFTRMQYIQTPKKPGARHYSPEEKVLTVSMYNSSPAGYAALSNFFTLPSEQLIEKFAQQVQKGLLKSLETNEEVEGGSNENVAADENRPPAKRKRGGSGHGGSSRGASGRGGGKLKHMRKINRHDLLPPPARLVAAPSASSNAGIHNFDENLGYFLPTVHSTVDVTTEGETVTVLNSSYYQRSLDMAIAGLTTDMPELD